MNDVGQAIEAIYETFEGDARVEDYLRRHAIDSLQILTVYDDERAAMIADFLAPQIEGKVVVEIGAGIGLLACHLAKYAFKVYAIEASPLWASCFAVALLKKKPKNCTYLLGAADELAGILRADVALYCTHSGTDAMREAGALFAPVVVDVYRDLLRDSTDPEIRALMRERHKTWHTPQS